MSTSGPGGTVGMSTFSAAGITTILLTLLGWSSVPLFIRYFADHIDVWTSNGWRYGFSALIWLPVVVWGLRRGTMPAGIFRASVVPSLFNALGQAAFAQAFYMAPASLVTFGLRTQIVFIALGAYLMFASERRVIRSRAYQAGFVCVLIGASGTMLLGAAWPTPREAWGLVFAVVSGALFAGYGLSVRKYMTGMHPVVAFSVISQYTAAVMVGLMLLLGAQGGAAALALDGTQMTMLLLSAVIGIALGHVFYYIAISRLGVAISSGVIQLQPFIVAAAAFPLFGERLTPLQWIGGVAAVSGALLMLSVQGRLAASDARVRRAAAAADGEARGEAELAVTGSAGGPSAGSARG